MDEFRLGVRAQPFTDLSAGHSRDLCCVARIIIGQSLGDFDPLWVDTGHKITPPKIALNGDYADRE